MSGCRWDRDAEDYLTDGQPCRTDDYGDPTRHCTARRTCANHIGAADLTCARCVAQTRNRIRLIQQLATIVTYEAIAVGVNSEAANLAGPAADYRVFSARRNLDRLWLMQNIPDINLERAMRNLLPDDDEDHPYIVLTRWHLMFAEDYGHDLPDLMSVSDSSAYLLRQLHRIAQDPEQDFHLFQMEIRHCCSHLESVLRNSHTPPRGAPCPSCEAPAPRLSLQHGHWCDDEDCERLHYPKDPDRWACPRDREHVWEEDDYRKWVADVYDEARREQVGA